MMLLSFDAGDVRNKTIIENITKHNMSDTNIISMFHKKKEENCRSYGRD